MDIQVYDCVEIPDGRIARVRQIIGTTYTVRVRTKSGKSNQFLYFEKNELKKIACPTGWMSPEGYSRYLKKTLAKMKIRNQGKS